MLHLLQRIRAALIFLFFSNFDSAHFYYMEMVILTQNYFMSIFKSYPIVNKSLPFSIQI